MPKMRCQQCRGELCVIEEVDEGRIYQCDDCGRICLLSRGEIVNVIYEGIVPLDFEAELDLAIA